MFLKILNFGCNWWQRFGHDSEDRWRYTRHAAFYNSAGIQCGNKVRRHWIVPGLVRFNGGGDFNPHFPNRALGQTFVSTEPTFALGGNRVVLHNRAKANTIPDVYLVVVTSERYGTFDLNSALWKSATVHPIAISQLREKQEAMLLMRIGDSVQTDVGRWELMVTNELSAGAILQLAD